LVTVEKIKLLLPDSVLVALTDDQETGAINEALISQIITDGYAYIEATRPNAPDAAKDEYVKVYALGNLYAYAGMDEKAREFQEAATSILNSLVEQTPLTGGVISVSSSTRQFDDEELEKW